MFVDGYFVGTADEFDGALQRLRVEAGEHELEFYLEGYRTARQPVLFRREGTITIKHAMEPVGAGRNQRAADSDRTAAGCRAPRAGSCRPARRIPRPARTIAIAAPGARRSETTSARWRSACSRVMPRS